MAAAADIQTDAESTCCFLNEGAGSGSAATQQGQLSELLASFGVTRIVTPERSDVEAAARRAVDSGCRRIIAAGGDGTVHAVANAVAGTEAALAVLPLGTLNHFARDLGIPLELEQAVRTAVAGPIRSVDIGEVNGRLFVNNSSIGLYPRLVREREALQRQGDGKWLALARAGAGVFRRSKAMPLRMHYDGRSVSTRSEFVFVGNNEYQFSAERLASRPQLDGGLLWVWRVPHMGRFRALAAATMALLGKGAKSPLTLVTDELVIEPRARRLLVAMDGETLEMEAPLTYRVRPRTLRVVVPPENSP